MSSRDSEALIQRHLDGIASLEEVAELSGQLESNAETRLLYLRFAHIHARLASYEIDEPSVSESEHRLLDLIQQLNSVDKRRRTRQLVLSVIAAAAILALFFGIYALKPDPQPQIATITSVDGAVQWTGGGGQVSKELQSGRPLTGGTLESLSIDSSVEFQFVDGTTVTVSGLSVLTISERGQKRLHLRSGTLSATVVVQPEGKPMLVMTPTAELEVVGTQFDVTADSSETKLIVTEGLVRATRLTDGTSVDVPAAHQMVATIEARNVLVASETEKPRHSWKAVLTRDVDQGKWMSAAHALRLEVAGAVEKGELTRDESRQVFARRFSDLRDDEGVLQAMPLRLGRDERRGVVYLVSLNASRSQSGPIGLIEDSTFRIQGAVRQPAEVTFGFGAVDADRTWGGRYLITKQVTGKFDIDIPISEFQLRVERSDAGPELRRQLDSWHCFTADREAMLEITGVELLGPD